MFKKFISALILSALFFAVCVNLRAQQPSGARNIFDQQVGQPAASNTGTEIRARSEAPVRPKSNNRAVPRSGGHIAKTAAGPAAKAEPIALKYSVVMMDKPNPPGYQRTLTKVVEDNGKYYGVADPDQDFKLGNVIRLVFEPSRDGYLYVLSLETDGSRNLLYPEPGPDPGKRAQVQKNTPVLIGPFRIEPPAGTDKLTVLLSNQPIKAFESGEKDLAKAFQQELESHDYATIEEEEVHSASQQKTALYFAAQGSDGLKAEIDIKHKQ